MSGNKPAKRAKTIQERREWQPRLPRAGAPAARWVTREQVQEALDASRRRQGEEDREEALLAAAWAAGLRRAVPGPDHPDHAKGKDVAP